MDRGELAACEFPLRASSPLHNASKCHGPACARRALVRTADHLLEPPRVATPGAPRTPGTAGRRGGGWAVTVQFTVLWQVPQSCVVLTCRICLPIALMPLWQLLHGAVSPRWLKLTAVHAIVP